MTTPDTAALLAQLDQAGAGMKGRARLMGEYFNELVANGFERVEAMELVHHYLEDLAYAEDTEGESDA
jgi:hypothetical protein